RPRRTELIPHEVAAAADRRRRGVRADRRVHPRECPHAGDRGSLGGMRIRRLFWLGAAILFAVAALVAIAAVLGGSFGTTQEHILEMCGIAFVCGAATLAGLGCIERGVIPAVGWVT